MKKSESEPMLPKSGEARQTSFFKRWVKKRFATGNPEVRDAWIEARLKALPPGYRLLDAGAGELRFKPFCGHLRYISQDFGQYDGIGDNSALQTGTWDSSRVDILSDITTIPESDASFDAVMCIEVLEHLPAPIDALKEFHRLLRKGGELILTAPFASLTHFAPYHYYSGFNQHFYSHWLEAFGFKILEMNPYGNYFDYLSQELLRTKSIAERYAGQKKALNLLEYFALFLTLKAFRRFSMRDEGSQEILCFGYMVRAVKL